MNESADFVMYWWDRAAELLTRKGTKLRRFGLVTTNSISQVFQRRVVERHLKAKRPVSMVMAIPDHPWTKLSPDAAAVRIAMTVVEAGSREGILHEVIREDDLDTDSPIIAFAGRQGRINSDLTVGIDVTVARALFANEGVCSPGMKLHGAKFIVTKNEAKHLGLGRRNGIDLHMRDYRNGRDLMARPRGVMVIDLFGLSADEVRQRFPEIYQHLLATVKPERDKNNRTSYRDSWWTFGEPRSEFRPALDGLKRYIATVETSKHRVFQFLDSAILPDNMLVAIASDDALFVGVLSSRIHTTWAIRAGGWLGMGNDPRYSKSRCFDPFPFPVAPEKQKNLIRAAAEELDSLRKRVLAEHPDLTLTGLYNVLAEVRRGVDLGALSADHQHAFSAGQVLILRELHDRLDAAVADAYGWPHGLSDEDILARVVALNRERAREEAGGKVRWLRPEYQIPRFGTGAQKTEFELAGAAQGQEGSSVARAKPAFPAEEVAQTAVIMATLAEATVPIDASTIAARFRQGRKIEPAVSATLAAIARMGFVVRSERGDAFSLRRATQ